MAGSVEEALMLMFCTHSKASCLCLSLCLCLLLPSSCLHREAWALCILRFRLINQILINLCGAISIAECSIRLGL